MATIYYNSKGINCSPTSSFLYTRIEDVDCSSASAFEKPPVDGQFIVAAGTTGDSGWITDAATTNKKFASATAGDLNLTQGPALAMVWLSQFKTDIDALGASKVPVVRGSLRVKTKYFHSPNDNIATDFAAGTLLTVASSTTATGASVGPTGSTSNKRLVLSPATTVSASAWVVGYVTQVVSTTSGSEEIEVQLYEFPRLATKAA